MQCYIFYEKKYYDTRRVKRTCIVCDHKERKSKREREKIYIKIWYSFVFFFVFFFFFPFLVASTQNYVDKIVFLLLEGERKKARGYSNTLF